MKKLDFYKQPIKFLEKFQISDKKTCLSVLDKIDELRINPLSNSSKKLAGHKDFYRIRVGKYRIIYRFDDKILSILLIAKRDEVYDSFLFKN
jgi:mRNA interferase RelE/StbE